MLDHLGTEPFPVLIHGADCCYTLCIHGVIYFLIRMDLRGSVDSTTLIESCFLTFAIV